MANTIIVQPDVTAPTLITELLKEVRYECQDSQKTRWTDAELYLYLNQAMRRIAMRTKYHRVVETIPVVKGTNSYPLSFEMIEAFDISTVQPHYMPNNNTINFEDAKTEDVTIDYYGYPEKVEYGVTTQLFLEADMYDMVRFYILYKAYKKEDSVENRSKAQEYLNDYKQAIAENSMREGKTLPLTGINDYLQ